MSHNSRSLYEREWGTVPASPLPYQTALNCREIANRALGWPGILVRVLRGPEILVGRLIAPVFEDTPPQKSVFVFSFSFVSQKRLHIDVFNPLL